MEIHFEARFSFELQLRHRQYDLLFYDFYDKALWHCTERIVCVRVLGRRCEFNLNANHFVVFSVFHLRAERPEWEFYCPSVPRRQ